MQKSIMQKSIICRSNNNTLSEAVRREMLTGSWKNIGQWEKPGQALDAT
jgi:hypothetical protein